MARVPLWHPKDNKLHARLFRVVDDVLRRDKVLASRKVRIRSWRGDADDAAEWTTAMSPGLRLTCLGTATTPETEGSTDAPLLIHVEAFVAGNNQDDALNLWGAVVEALYPGDKSVLARIESAGGFGYRLGDPAYGWTKADEGGGQLAVGSLYVLALQPTNI